MQQTHSMVLTYFARIIPYDCFIIVRWLHTIWQLKPIVLEVDLLAI